MKFVTAVTGVLVIAVDPVVIDQVIFTQFRNVLRGGSGIHDARHRLFPLFTHQIKTAALILTPIDTN